MVTGKNKCFICNKKYSGRSESSLKRWSGKRSSVTKNKIYEHACMSCARKRRKSKKK